MVQLVFLFFSRVPTWCDAQVRTAHMHSEAEGGTASHSLYKGSLENPEEASLFRSKMAANILSPAHRLPAKTKSRKPAVTGPPGAPGEGGAAMAAATVPALDAKAEERGLDAGAQLAQGLEGSNRSPEP